MMARSTNDLSAEIQSLRQQCTQLAAGQAISVSLLAELLRLLVKASENPLQSLENLDANSAGNLELDHMTDSDVLGVVEDLQHKVFNIVRKDLKFPRRPGLPAQCGTCSLIFHSGMDIRNTSNMTIVGGEVQCPRCGNMARIAEGTYSFYDDVIRIVRAPDISREMLRSFAMILKDAYNQKISIDELEARARDIHPRLSEAVSKVKEQSHTRKWFLRWLGMICFALGAIAEDVATEVIADRLIEQLFGSESTLSDDMTLDPMPTALSEEDQIVRRLKARKDPSR